MSPNLKVSCIFGIVLAVLVQQSLATTEVKFCVENGITAQKKCEKMSELVKDVKLVCTLNLKCEETVATGQADVAVIDADRHFDALKYLEPVLFESFDSDNIMVGVIKADQELKCGVLPLDYNTKDFREVHAALYLNHHREESVCKNVQPAKGAETIQVMRYPDLKDTTNKKLVCVEKGHVVVKPISEYKTCNIEADIPNAVMIKKESSKKNDIVKMMNKLTETHANGFKLFGTFENKANIIFSDDAKTFVSQTPTPNGVTVEKFHDLHCGDFSHSHSHSHSH